MYGIKEVMKKTELFVLRFEIKCSFFVWSYCSFFFRKMSRFICHRQCSVSFLLTVEWAAVCGSGVGSGTIVNAKTKRIPLVSDYVE